MRTSISKYFTDCVPMVFPGVSFLIQDTLFESKKLEQPVVVLGACSKTCLPIKRDTKSKGDLSELVVAVALTKAGYAVSKPLGENQRYDLIADDGERLHRVQVKTGRVRDGVVKFSCCSTHGHRRTGNLATRPYTGQIELLAVYCPENEKVYLVPEADLTRSVIHLRLVAPRNNMTKSIRWASRYELA
jgi:PD-(D/E)XK nuclease superfamily protein